MSAVKTKNSQIIFGGNSLIKLFMIVPFKILLLLNFYKKEHICVCNPPQLVAHTLFILRKANMHWNTSAAPGGAAR